MQVGEKTNESRIQCKCSHLTSFAANLFVAPNPIHLEKVILGFKNFHDNFTTTVIIIAIIALYALVIIYLRKKDISDKDKVRKYGVASIFFFKMSHCLAFHILSPGLSLP